MNLKKYIKQVIIEELYPERQEVLNLIYKNVKEALCWGLSDE